MVGDDAHGEDFASGWDILSREEQKNGTVDVTLMEAGAMVWMGVDATWQ